MMKHVLTIILLFCCAASFSQDTTINTYTVTHDTTITTTIPEQIVHVGDSIIVISDTSYNIFFQEQVFSTVDGTITTTIPLYDTIPAHDTTFNCVGCAVHDTTVIIISPRTITIRANDQSKIYGQTFLFAGNGSQVAIVSGSLKAGDIITVDNATSTGAVSSANVGTYAITLSSVTITNGATNVTGNYVITYQPGTLSVTAAPLTVKADDQSKVYGQLFTFTNNGSDVTIVSGILGAGDVISADNSNSTGASATANAGTYTISLSSITITDGATNVTSNYTITYQTGTLTVSTAPITIKANDQGKTAGQTFVFTHNGTQVSVTSGSLISGDAITADNAASTGAASGAAAGTYAITLSSVTITRGATNVTSNYSITYVPGTLTVGAAPLIITVAPKPQSKVYGSTFTFLNNGTQVNVVSGSLQSGDVITVDNAASTGATASAVAGSYTITLSSITITNGATNVTGNYTISYQTSALTVSQKPITIKANNQTKAWGSTFTFLGNGTQVGITSGSLATGDAISTDNAASTGAVSSANAGTYNITLSAVTILKGAANVTSSYAITYQPGTLTVTARAITVRANNQIKTQGTTFTFTHNGSQVSVVSGSLLSGNAITVDNAASSGASSGAAAGNYTITLSSVTITAGATNVTSNYAITYQAGTMTVNAPNSPGTMYGIYPAASDYGTNIFDRMDHAKYVGVPLFRYNYDYIQQSGTAPTFRVVDIVNYGLKADLTFNHVANAMQWANNRTVDNNFPNTQQEITFYSSKLDSLLKSLPANKKPEVIHINNEEGHRQYWSGTVPEYLTWMEACVQVGHANGVAVTNGGTTIGIVYAMLQWYIDLGKPQDSINFIKNAYGITGNANGPFATEQREWYETLLAGFAVSDMDYVNVHWYEPARDNTTDIVTSKLIPLVINYVQSVTGKGVITSEAGVKNGNYGLAYEYFDQWKAAGVKYFIYYAGNSDQGAQSYDNSEAYKLWLLQ